MKNRWIRPISSILCLPLMLSLLIGTLSGCGKTGLSAVIGGDKKTEPLDHYRLSYTIVQAPRNSEENYAIQTAHITTDSVYFVVQSETNTAPDQLYCTPFDEGDTKLLYTAEERHSIGLFSPDVDGAIWFLENDYKAIDENGSGTVDVYIKKIDKAGTVQVNTLLETEKQINGIGAHVSGLAVNDQGKVFVAKSYLDEDNHQNLDIYWMDENNLTPDKKVTTQEDAPILSVLPDGRAAISYLNEKEELRIRPINTDTAAFEDEIAFNTNLRVYRGNGHFTMLGDQGAVYKWEDTKTTSPLIIWKEYAIDDYIKELTITNDGILYGMVDAGERVEICKMTPCTASEAAKTVTIAGYFGVSEPMQEQIKAFNKSQSDHIAILKNYADYASNTESAYTKLETEIMADNVPDVLCLDGHISNRVLISKGVLQDLYPYLDKDDAVNRDFFVEEILASLTVDGKLYQVATAFTLDTMIADRRVVGDEKGLTFARMEQLQKENPDKSLFFKDFSRDKLMSYLAYSCFTDFINWETGECHFENEAFVKLLNTAKSRPTIDDIFQSWGDSPNEEIVDEFELLKDGEILLAANTVYNASSYLGVKALLGDNAVYIGFPSENGMGTVRYTVENYGILSGSKNKEGAWQFLRWTLLNARDTADPTEFADPYSGFGVKPFPASRAAFEEQLAYFQSSKGSDGTPLTNEDVTLLKEIIKTAKPATSYDREIAAIIVGEASFFFADKCTAAQAAEKIQKRVSIYVGEQQ